MVGPSYPKHGSEVIRTVKAVMDNVECANGRQLSLKRFGILLGVPRSTIHDWYYGSIAAPIMHFLCALERVPEDQRLAILRELPRNVIAHLNALSKKSDFFCPRLHRLSGNQFYDAWRMVQRAAGVGVSIPALSYAYRKRNRAKIQEEAACALRSDPSPNDEKVELLKKAGAELSAEWPTLISQRACRRDQVGKGGSDARTIRAKMHQGAMAARVTDPKLNLKEARGHVLWTDRPSN